MTTIDLTQVRGLFFEESFENLDVMESSLLDLEIETFNEELINNIFRAAHSIKGGAGIFHLDDIVTFAHNAETLLDEVREGKHDINQVLIDLLLRVGDILRIMLTASKDEVEYDTQEMQICQEALKKALIESVENIEEIPTVESESVEESVENFVEDIEQTSKEWHIEFKPELPILKTGNDPINLFRELQELGELEIIANTDAMPDFADLEPQLCYLSWNLVLNTTADRADIEEVFEWIIDECELNITESVLENSEPKVESQEESEPVLEIIEETPEVETSATEEKTTVSEDTTYTEKVTISEDTTEPVHEEDVVNKQLHTQSGTNSIRVGIDKIDNLINIVGELVITQSMLDQIGENFAHSDIIHLRDGLSQLERNTRELQENVMRIRMLPISVSFNRFPRLVHDLSTQLGKKVELILSGEHTELDKTVLEKMSDPLVHLVRNSLDHGIESPEQRKQVGKPEVGQLHLNAFHQSGNIVIQISDDGAGFDVERIRAKAVQKGWITQEEKITEEQLYEFIFQPGFSTSEEVSDLSGRGVGMDVVRRNIRALGGSIEVKSETGKGSKFSIRLPLTLAILDGQLVRVGNDIFVLPLLSIMESLRVQTKLVNSFTGTVEIYKLRDDYIPILRLYKLFDIENTTTKLEQGLLVIAEGDGQKIGLFVDELLSQQQIVIKNLENNYKKVQGVSGATILGDGNVALILDITGLIQLFRNQTKSPPHLPLGTIRYE
ncbi:chemotaxis protein CheA [Candidatus Halobeggiatoa sp. HSG11]|nr:chemotaxis protein CheA [Candidatus Halobeggiatoa sp. HSG11]